MIINIEPYNFGGTLRNGDIIASLNLLQHLRIKENNNEIKFFIGDHSVNPAQYCYEFRNWLVDNTDYLSSQPGTGKIESNGLNLWDARSFTGDVISIRNDVQVKKKICVFPLLDAQYNFYRNWSVNMTNDIINHYMKLLS